MLGKCRCRESFCSEAFSDSAKEGKTRKKTGTIARKKSSQPVLRVITQIRSQKGSFFLQSVPRTQEGPRDKPNHIAKIHIDKLRFKLKLSSSVNLIGPSVRNLV